MPSLVCHRRVCLSLASWNAFLAVILSMLKRLQHQSLGAHSPPSCRTLFADAGNVQAVFDNFINLPDSWPLMRIMIPLDGLSLQVERIISCAAAESFFFFSQAAADLENTGSPELRDI